MNSWQRTTLLLMITLLLTGCASSRRENYVRKNAVDPYVKEVILEGQICNGMSMREVRASWGEPYRIRSSMPGFDTWVYRQYRLVHLVYFDHGYVRGWSVEE